MVSFRSTHTPTCCISLSILINNNLLVKLPRLMFFAPTLRLFCTVATPATSLSTAPTFVSAPTFIFYMSLWISGLKRMQFIHCKPWRQEEERRYNIFEVYLSSKGSWFILMSSTPFFSICHKTAILSLPANLEFAEQEKKKKFDCSWTEQNLTHVTFFENINTSIFLWTKNFDRDCVCNPNL